MILNDIFILVPFGKCFSTAIIQTNLPGHIGYSGRLISSQWDGLFTGQLTRGACGFNSIARSVSSVGNISMEIKTLPENAQHPEPNEMRWLIQALGGAPG
jgi:hypothetical protein